MPPIIDKEKCIGCGACVAACPNDAIELVEDKAVLIKEKCKDVWDCIEACPVEAISKP